MTSMPYGAVRLSGNDRMAVCAILTRRGASLMQTQMSATVDKERAFYAQTLGEYKHLVTKLSTAGAGKVPFAEDELKTLRGALFGSEKPELMTAWRAAREAGDEDTATALMAKVQHLEALDRVLNRPFELDRSQDAEDSEEEDEQNDGLDARAAHQNRTGAAMSEKIILAQRDHPLGGFFLARLPDGKFEAGRTENTASRYPSLQAVYDTMYQLASNGSHWAWNICYEVESLI